MSEDTIQIILLLLCIALPGFLFVLRKEISDGVRALCRKVRHANGTKIVLFFWLLSSAALFCYPSWIVSRTTSNGHILKMHSARSLVWRVPEIGIYSRAKIDVTSTAFQWVAISLVLGAIAVAVKPAQARKVPPTC